MESYRISRVGSLSGILVDFGMKLLQSVQKYFGMMGIQLPQDDQNTPFNWKNRLCLSLLVLAFILIADYIATEAKTVSECGASFFVFETEFFNSIYFFVNIRKAANISKLIDEFEGFVEKRTNAASRIIMGSNIDSKLIYNKMNESIETMCKAIYFMTVTLTVPGTTLPLFCLSFFNYFILDLKEDSFYLPFPAVLPFDWKTPLGYLIGLSIESLVAFITCLFCACIMCFFVGVICILKSLVEDITNDLQFLECDRESEQSRSKLKRHFCEIIQLYSEAKQFVKEFNKIYGFITTCCFLWSLIAISASLLVIHSQLSQDVMDPIEFVIPIFFVFWSIVWIAFFCESGITVTNEFEKFNYKLSQCDWYLFPIEIQQMLVTVISNTTQPALIRGYGNALCTRELLKETINKGFSYFMVLRQVDG